MTIFPNSISDADRIIISFCDVGSLVNLSGVNLNAYQALSNNSFFKDLFNFQHPSLEQYKDKLFTKLRSCHPTNCFKIICQALSSLRSGVPLLQTRVFDKQGDIFGLHKTNQIRWNSVLVNEALPNIFTNLHSRKSKSEERLKVLCGSYFADPGSALDIAWKKQKTCQEELEILKAEFKPIDEEYQQRFAQLIEPLKTIHSDWDLRSITHFLSDNGEIFLAQSDEEFRNSPEAKDGMDINHLPLYRDLARFFLELKEADKPLRSKTKEWEDLSFAYENLENERVILTDTINNIDNELKKDSSELLVNHQIALSDEITSAFGLEKALAEHPRLNKCKVLIQKLLDHPEEKTPEALDSIRQMINALTCDDKAYIWGSLYRECANGVHEDRWSENHFQDHLFELKDIVWTAETKYLMQIKAVEKS